MSRPRGSTAAALAAVLLFAAAPPLPAATVAEHATADAGVAVATLELEGPLEEVWLEAGSLPTRVAVPLAAGERRTVRAPVSLGAAGPETLAIRILPEEASGQARLVELGPARPDVWDAELSTRLTMRSRPPLAPRLARPDALRLLVVAAALVAALALRRRPAWALAAGCAGAALVLALPGPASGAAGARVVEGRAGGGGWVVVDGAVGSIDLPLGRLPFEDVLQVEEASDEEGPLTWNVAVAPGGGERWSLVGPGRWIYLVEELEPAPELARAANRWRVLARVWLREPGRGFAAHGRWEVGTELPAELPSGAPPPGWLAAGLPQGVGILLGELEPAPGEPQGPAWVRLVGF